MGDKNNFKGIFYNVNEEQKFFEGGAHFKYSDLVKKLQNLIKKQEKNLNICIEKINNQKEEKHIKINRFILKNKLEISRNLKTIPKNKSPEILKNFSNGKKFSKLKLNVLEKDLLSLRLKKRIDSEKNLTLPKIKNNANESYKNNEKNLPMKTIIKTILFKPRENKEKYDINNNLYQSNKSLFDDFSQNSINNSLEKKKNKLLFNISPNSKLFSICNGSILNSSIYKINTSKLKLPKQNKIKFN